MLSNLRLAHMGCNSSRKVTLRFAVAPTSNQYRAVVVG